MSPLSDNDGESSTDELYSGSGETTSSQVWLLYYYIYLMAAGAVIVVFAVFIVTVLIVRRKKHRRAKLNITDNCDYENIADQAIIELFEVLDKRNNSTSIKSPTSLANSQISPTEKSLSSGHTFTNAHELIISSQLNSLTLADESIDSKNHPINSPVVVNVSLLKPLSTKPTLSCESVYDELDSINSPQHKDELSLENVYDDARTLSPKLSPQPFIEHVYDDTITSPPEARNKPQHSSSGNRSLNSATLRQHNEVLFRMGGDQTRGRKDVISVSTEGYYVLPDNFPPPSSYSYTKTHHLVMPHTGDTANNSQPMGEIRVQNGHHQTTPATSVYTNIDEVIPQRRRDSAYMQIEDSCVRTNGVSDTDPGYSNIYELDNDKYVYVSEHMLVSPTRKDATCGEVVTKPQEHHEYDPIVTIRPKSNSLPGNAHSTAKGHTYVNLKSSKTLKVSSSKLDAQTRDQDVKFHFGNETANPIYSSTDELDVETVNPLYADSSQMRDEALMHQDDSKTQKVGGASNSRDPSTNKDYFTSTREWFEPPKTTRMVLTEEEGFIDHTYMGILVRERVDHDYSYPKPSAKTQQVTFSGNPKQERKLRIKRTYSLDNAYQNQAMWLPEKEGGKSRGASLYRENSSGYMGLYTTGYESPYNKTFSLSQV